VTGVAGIFGKLFKDTEKQVNPVRQSFVDMAGGLHLLNVRAQDAGMTLTALLNAKTPEAYKKAIDDLNAAFAFQDAAMKTLDETVKKYGFTIDELGPKFAQQKLDEQALALYQDYRVLIAAGIENVDVIGKMAPAMNDYIQATINAGVAIPKQLQPVAEEMLRLGLLTDASGKAMTDLGQLTFAETLDQKFTTLIETIQKLADAISRGLGTAIANVPAVEVPVHWNFDKFDPAMLTEGARGADNAARGGIVTSAGMQHLAAGGRVLAFTPRGTDTVPAMLTPGEGVVTRTGMGALGTNGLRALNRGGPFSGGGGAPAIDIRPHLERIEQRLAAAERAAARQAQQGPEQTATAIRDALMQAGVGRR